MAIDTPGFTDFASNGSCDVSFPELTCGSIDCALGTTACTTISVVGGVAPYTWSTSKGVISGSGASVTLCPGANTGFNVAGAAICKQVKYCCTFTGCSSKSWGCNDQSTQACTSVGGCSCPGMGSCACSSCAGCTNLSGCINSASCSCKTNPSACWCCGGGGSCCGTTGCECLQTHGTSCDVRSAGQISGGCVPCTISMAGGVVVTVEDALGNQAFCTVSVVDPDGKAI